jgi:hypothetical protein
LLGVLVSGAGAMASVSEPVMHFDRALRVGTVCFAVKRWFVRGFRFPIFR